jgi:uncharacterized protein (TIGR02147 family)
MSNEALNTLVKAPAIWDFVEPIEFLKAHYQYRKVRETGFSFAVWAQEMGIKSRSFLRLVMIGKRGLSEELESLFIENLKLNKSETTYFEHLARLQRASQLSAREYHSREIAKLRKKFQLKNHTLDEVNPRDLFDFLSSYRIPRLQVLLTLDGIKKTPANLASLLQVKENEVLQNLRTLQSLNFAREEENGEWIALKAELGTPDALGNIALQSFHRKSLEEAIQSLTLPKQTRRYQSLVMTLTEEQMEGLHQELRNTIENYLQGVETPIEIPQKVYQVNLNIIPVTGTIDRSSTSETVESVPTGKEK